MQINNLIKLYFHVCNKYTEQICFEVQRHSNNQRAGIVWEPQDYKYSSATDYYTGSKGLIDIIEL